MIRLVPFSQSPQYISDPQHGGGQTDVHVYTEVPKTWRHMQWVYTWFWSLRKLMFMDVYTLRHLYWFPRWTKSCIPRLFHIIYLYYTSLFVCLSATAKYHSRVLQVSCEDLGTAQCLNDNHDCSVTLLLPCRSLTSIFVLHKLHGAYSEVYASILWLYLHYGMVTVLQQVVDAILMPS